MNSNKYAYGIIYHDHCVDGFSSAYVVWKYLLGEVAASMSDIKLIPATYKQENAVLKEAEDCEVLYMVDFSVPPQWLEMLAAAHPHITIIDHHRTAIMDYADDLDIIVRNTIRPLAKFPGVIMHYDLLECGASLSHKVLYSRKPMPLFLEFVRDRDLWEKKLEHCDEIAAVMQLTPKTVAAYDIFFNYFDSNFPTLVQQGEAILAYKRWLVVNAAKRAVPISLMEGKQGLVVDSDYAIASELGEALAKKSGTYGVVRCGTSYSLRSIGDYDVSVIAKLHGGGGHKNAAGFSLEPAQR